MGKVNRGCRKELLSPKQEMFEPKCKVNFDDAVGDEIFTVPQRVKTGSVDCPILAFSISLCKLLPANVHCYVHLIKRHSSKRKTLKKTQGGDTFMQHS